MNIRIEDHGSIVLFVPLDAAAKGWLEENTDAEAWQWRGGALAVDHRAAEALAAEGRDRHSEREVPGRRHAVRR